MKADENSIRKLFKELKKTSDEEEVRKVFDNFLQRKINPDIGVTRKAILTDNVMHQLLGEAALDEIAGLKELPTQEAFEKAKEVSNKGLGKLEKSLDISPKISIEDLSKYKAHGLQDPYNGISIDKRYDTPDIATKQLGLGTLFHETSHSIDDVAKRFALAEREMQRRSSPDSKLQLFRKLNDPKKKLTALEMMSDEELARYYSQAKDSLDEYVKNNPNKIDTMVKDSGILNFESQKVPDLISNEFKDMTPTKLQNLYSGTGHWFKRNFPFENLQNVLKKGIKGIKSIGPIAGGIGAYGALKSGDVAATGLNLASMLDPTGISDAALEVKDRLKEKDPEEIKKIVREDKYKAMGIALSPSDIILDQLEDIKDKKNSKIGEKKEPDLEEMDNVFNYEDYLKKKKKQMGYE